MTENIIKLTDWPNEPTLKQLTQDLEMARQAHIDWIGDINRWNELMEISGSAKPKKFPNKSVVQPRLIRKQAEWRYPALSEPFLSSDRIFQVKPRTFEDVQAAKQNELILNYQFDTKLNKVKFIDDLVRAVVNDGTAIVRIGWDIRTKTVVEEIPVYSHTLVQDQEYMQQLQHAVALKQTDPNGFNTNVLPEIKASVAYFEQSGQPTVAQQIGTEQVEKEEIVENKPVLDILYPNNVYIDPSCNGDLDRAMFVVVSFETSKAELYKAGIYKNLENVDWNNAATPEIDAEHFTLTPSGTNFSDTFRKKIIAYEYWGFQDLYGDNTLTPFVATWVGNTIIRMELNPFPDQKLPFVIIPYLPVTRALYGEPDAKLLEEDQTSIGAILRGIIDTLANSANGQKGFAKGMLDNDNMRKFRRGEDYEFNPVMPVQNGYIDHTYPEIPQSVILLYQLLNQDAESLTGIKSFETGLNGDAYGSTATGARSIITASKNREMSILRRISQGVAKIGNKIVSMNSVFLSEQEVIRVTNEQFVKINREDLNGNFDLIVDINTAEVDDSKAQKLAFMLQTIGPNAGPEITMMILSKIADLYRIPDLAKKLEQWKPQPDPVMEELKKAQVQLVQSEAQLNQAKAAEAQTSQQLGMAKTQTEQAKLQLDSYKVQTDAALAQAKIEETKANTESIIIDNKMEYYGIKHANEMDKQQAQANANQKLEISKALLKPRKPDETRPDVQSAIKWVGLSKDI